MKIVKLFSDGSCLGNPGVGGWAYILEYNEYQKKDSGASEKTTNNQMELTAAIMGIKALKEPCKIELFTDSSYVANAINSWLNNWIKKDFKKVQNIELWKEYIKVSSIHSIKAFWVKGHSGHKQNEECDKMARDAANKLKNG
ncbi:ribonuclease HI [Campylobacter sp. RM12327]|uniref:ribonuclease HI n=1 Tax=Campylobacter sputorum TaxID=206 RepID=UPI00053BD959|nr:MULTISPECIES: ribonuclease HI [Campylobacter]ASM39512.1 ribonuclease HI [Campylobacter sputorum]MBE7358418.1 ribonuclease HI [Campylobacter sp. RM11302]MBF6670124.1 ribonuclease HI [Campylobacter sp. RM12327]MBF6675251.1 ribonuclease HI [Campylobacter sp. RM13538]MBF6676870.1 ribonuclease HI [Campylobacter sp. RM12321]